MTDLSTLSSILNPDKLNTYASFIVMILIIGNFILTLRSKSLEDIRSDVYEAFLRFEKEITGTKVGQQRLEKAVEYAYGLIPVCMRFFITKAFLRKTIDKWFKQIKKLLDDGKPEKEKEIKSNLPDINEEIQVEEDCPDDDGDM